jgi:hypothetical protein
LYAELAIFQPGYALRRVRAGIRWRVHGTRGNPILKNLLGRRNFLVQPCSDFDAGPGICLTDTAARRSCRDHRRRRAGSSRLRTRARACLSRPRTIQPIGISLTL